MPFGFFKKKTKEVVPHYDPTNIKLTDLRKGFLLDYNLATWEVVEEYEYDWGDNNFSYEYKLESSDDHCFLNIDEEDEIIATIFRKIAFGKLDAEVEKALLQDHRPPRKIEFEGKTYFREGEYPGYSREIDEKNWHEFVSWVYYDESEDFAFSIEQWGDTNFSAAVGKVEPLSAFSNILPTQRNDV